MQQHPLWRYSLRVYPMPGVEALLLALQDDVGADINMLLACCWLAAEGRRLSEAKRDAALAKTRAWQHDCVEPLRRIRRLLKGDPARGGFCERVKALELEAEQIQQQQLFDVLRDINAMPVGVSFRQLALQNLCTYGARIPGTDMNALSELLLELVVAVEGVDPVSAPGQQDKN